MKLRTQKDVLKAFFRGESAECGLLKTHNKRLYYKGDYIAVWAKSSLLLGTQNKRLHSYITKYCEDNGISIYRDYEYSTLAEMIDDPYIEWLSC